MRTKTAKQNRRSKIVEFLKITKIVYNIRLLTCKYVDLFVYEHAQSTIQIVRPKIKTANRLRANSNDATVT